MRVILKLTSIRVRVMLVGHSSQKRPLRSVHPGEFPYPSTGVSMVRVWITAKAAKTPAIKAILNIFDTFILAIDR